jgi:hypothetical protein
MLSCWRLRYGLILTLSSWVLLPQATLADARRTRAHQRARNTAGSVAPSKRSVARTSPAPLERSRRGRWSAGDESWYRRNRTIRIVSGVLTAVGGLLLITGGIKVANANHSEYDYKGGDWETGWNLSMAGAALYGTGSVVLAASTLYGANEMRRRGKRVSKVPGILSVVGIFAPPMLWIAAPIQGANLRRAHDEVAPGLRSSSGKVLGLSLRAEF